MHVINTRNCNSKSTAGLPYSFNKRIGASYNVLMVLDSRGQEGCVVSKN
jgi:hypothetical protein